MTVVRPTGSSQQVVVPARPRAPAARQQRARRCAGPPRWAGRGSRRGSRARVASASAEHRQRLVGVGREDDLVEALGLAAARASTSTWSSTRWIAAPACGAAGGRAERPDERLHVAARAARRRCASAAGRGSRASRGCRRTRPGSAPGSSTSGAGRPTRPPRPAARSAGRRTAREKRRSSSHSPERRPIAARAPSSARASRLKRSRSRDHPLERGRDEVRAVARTGRSARRRVLEVAAPSLTPKLIVRRLRRARRARPAGARSSGSCGR